MEIITKVTLDMVRNGVPPVIDAVQGEFDSRIIELHIFKNGELFDLTGHIASLAYKKPDGTSGWYDTMPDESPAYTVNGNVISMKIAPQVLTSSGNVDAAVRIETEDNTGRATTFPLVIRVSGDPAADASKSENYYKVQNWDSVNAAIEKLYNDIANIPGGGGGATIHIEPYVPEGEFDYDDFSSKYKVGDLLYATDTPSLHILTAIDGDEDFAYPVWEQIYPNDSSDSSDSFASVGHESQYADGDAPTAYMRVYFRGEWYDSMISGYGATICTYNGSLYFTDGYFLEGIAPDEEDSGWVKLTNQYDKESIVADVIAALPVYDGGVV